MAPDAAVAVHRIVDEVLRVREAEPREERPHDREGRVEDAGPVRAGGRQEDAAVPGQVLGRVVERARDEPLGPAVLGPVDQSLELGRDAHAVDRRGDREHVRGGHPLEQRDRVVLESAGARPVAGVAATAGRVRKGREDHLLGLRAGPAGPLEERVEQGLGVPVPVRAARDAEHTDHDPSRSRRVATASRPSAAASARAVGWRSTAPASSTLLTSRERMSRSRMPATW